MLGLTLFTALLVASATWCSAEPVNNYIFSINSDNTYGGGWTVESSNGSIKVDATVPGGIYSDLMRAGIIGDVYFKDNDVQTRWVSKTNWIYKRTFMLTTEMFEKSAIDIVFDGLDTISSITVNGNAVGSTDNMFIRYKFKIKPYLQEGENEIAITFASPVLTAASLSDIEMVPRECVPDIYNGECQVNQLRKMQASFSWDWGPALPSVGIWKPATLEIYNSGVFNDLFVYLTRNEEDDRWDMTLNIHMDVAPTNDSILGTFQFFFKLENGVEVSGTRQINANARYSEIHMSITTQVYDGNVLRWWPNGYGDQPLYSLNVTFLSANYDDEYFYRKVNIGFRTVELIQEDFDEGQTFYFKVNGIPIFMKGSNWIPANILPENSYDKETVDFLLQSAKDVHMNMLRVWGGGIYESNYFYEKCDELGILIWQDLMFACSMYPVNPDYLSSVSTEVEQAVKRIQHHPSIALWAGNNENEAALSNDWYGTSINFSKYRLEYVHLYVDTIKPIVTEFDRRTYVVSSPSSGMLSEQNGYVAQDPYDPNYGDSHYYNYIGDLWSMDTYPKTRFASEYGFQSLPSMDTLATATDDPNDLKIESEFMAHRQHSPNNNYGNMETHIINQFGELDKNDANYPIIFQYYTQVMQAWAMKTETEFYRQSRDDWMTMGALYWQLNDVWQAPTWSGIDFAGNWKMLHFYAKDFFSPVLISPRLMSTDEIVIRIINDKVNQIENVKMTVDTFSWDSFTPQDTQTLEVTIPPLSAENYGTNIVLPPTASRSLIFYRFSLRDADSNLISPYNYIFPVAMKSIQGYTAPTVSFAIVNPDAPGPVYDVDVTSTGIGLFVWLQVDQSFGRLSDNGFIMTERTKRIQLRINTKMNLQKFNEIKVKVFDKEHFA